MGVPKFFRYISERYPCLSELAREQTIPEFDNLYLDMNGIIHNCSHPDDGNVQFRITEEDMFRDIFNYIDKLFFLIKPQKLFFMAVDGVAPRAKMNQQRSRRFRTAKEMATLEQNAINKGEKLPEGARFDSNCITPGTEFMERLQNALKYFVKSKISTDPLWRKCRVILSGHDTPGEGEHKIMDYIRYLKCQTGYDPNTRHCMYGLDADLIILGLCTHELHFSLLREEVKFAKKSKRTSIEETRFFLLHLGLLREYLELEFNELKSYGDGFNVDRLVDDWILMGFLVGNDFIPHLPNLHINSNALPILYKAYMKVWPSLGGNINEDGELNLERLEKFFEELAICEFEQFKENYADLKYFEAKKSKNGIDEAFDIDIDEVKECADDDLANLIQQTQMIFDDDEINSETEEDHIEEEFKLYKRNYYMTKLNYPEMTPQVLEEQTQCYITGLQWILYYYYKGVQSWSWFYPHHYAPFVSDVKQFRKYKIEFQLGKPFLPFQQLLAVLPSASKELLPEAYRELMTNEKSELIDFYPKDFETDMNGKKQEWEAVVLIPFIEEKALLNAMEPCQQDLSEDEVRRNSHGPMLQYDYIDTDQGECPGFAHFKTLYKVFCTEKQVWREDIYIDKNHVCKGQFKDALSDVFFPGFPTMKHLKYTSDIRSTRVKVFEQPSRNENMILIPEIRSDYSNLVYIAERFINKIVYIGWPHLTRSKVVAVSTKDKRIDIDGVKSNDERLYELHVRTIKDHHLSRMGIEFTDLSVIVHVQTLMGSTYAHGSHGKMILNEVWSSTEIAYPAQGIVSDISVHNSNFVSNKKIEEVFPVNSTIFFIGNPHFGSEGTVLDPLLVYECGRLKVNIIALPEPDFTKARIAQKDFASKYMSTHEAAAYIQISSNVIARITGSILVIDGNRIPNIPESCKKTNIGLCLKFPKQQEELVGYTRKAGNIWLYSIKALDLVRSYYDKYPKVFEVMSQNNSNDIYFESDLFPGQVGENCLGELVAWIKQQEQTKSDRVSCGTKTVEKEAAEEIVDAIEQLKQQPVKNIKLQVKPHLLLKPELCTPWLYKPKRSLRLFDRVVVVKSTYQVPLGFKGTVVAIHPVIDPNPVRMENVKQADNFYEVLFDKNLPEGNAIHGVAPGRVFKVPEEAVLLIYNSDSSADENRKENYMAKQLVPPSHDKPIKIMANNSKSYSEAANPTLAIKTQDFTNSKCASNSGFWAPSSSSQKSDGKQEAKGGNRSSGGFWAPSSNTKPTPREPEVEQRSKRDEPANPIAVFQNFVEKANANANMNKSTLRQNSGTNMATNVPNHSFKQTPQDDGTNALMNMLGLKGNDKKMSTEQKATKTVPKNMSASAWVQPPPPPPNWRNDALNIGSSTSNKPTSSQLQNIPKTHKSANSQQQLPRNVNRVQPMQAAPLPLVNQYQQGTVPPQFYPPQPMQMPHFVNNDNDKWPLHYYGQNLPQFAPQQQLPFVNNDNFYSPVNLNQKGAFIPLQVQRGGWRGGRSGRTDEKNNATKASNENQNSRKGSTRKVDASEAPKKAENTRPAAKTQQSTNAPKPPRTPKIAAKFDNLS